MDTKPPITGTMHALPFGQLSPHDFERLCLWLVEREATITPSTWALRAANRAVMWWPGRMPNSGPFNASATKPSQLPMR